MYWILDRHDGGDVADLDPELTRVKFSMQISIFKQLYLFTEALSGKSEHNSDSLKI